MAASPNMKKRGFVLFLCFLISNLNIHPAESQNKPNQEVTVTADYEACFKDISQSTGDYLTFSNKAQEALKEASEKEDYHYLLVYQPKGPLETRGKTSK